MIRRLFGNAAYEALVRRRQAIQSKCYAWRGAPEAFVDDLECPYVTPPGRPFVWLRSRQIGGRMVIPGHGCQYYRLGPDDFGPTWPMQYGELEPWYALVERRIGLMGARDNVGWLPDSEISKALYPTPAEAAFQRSVSRRWPGARPVIGRIAPHFDALEVAARTGRLLIRTGAIVREIEVDESGRVRGATWIDH
jgi:choline dehydrogenase-like flavoprotein